MGVVLRSRREILSYPQWVYNCRLCYGKEVEAWESNRNDWGTYRLSMSEDKAGE